jgi:hypothetical protein
MEIKEFVKETLVQIIEGVKDAQKQIGTDSDNGEIIPVLSRHRAGDNLISYSGNVVHNVHFDVAVTVAEGSETKGGAGIQVASLLEIGGSKGKSASNTSQSRIQFHVPITYPNTKQKQ